MAILSLNDCRIVIGEYDVSGDSNSGRLTHSADIKDCTVFGNTFHARAGGSLSYDLEVGGYWDSINGTPMFQRIAAVQRELTMIPEGFTTGNDAIFGRAINATYKIGGSIGELYEFDLSAAGSGTLVNGTLMQEATIESTGTTTSTPQQLGAVSSTQALYGNLHVLAISGTSADITVKSQSSATEGGAYADRITWTTATAIGSEWATDTTTDTDTWHRLEVVVSAIGAVSVHFLAAVGIEAQ